MFNYNIVVYNELMPCSS